MTYLIFLITFCVCSTVGVICYTIGFGRGYRIGREEALADFAEGQQIDYAEAYERGRKEIVDKVRDDLIRVFDEGIRELRETKSEIRVDYNQEFHPEVQYIES